MIAETQNPHENNVPLMVGVVAIVLVSAEPDLSIIDVETQQSQTGAGRDTHRVPQSRAPGGKTTKLSGEIGEAQHCPPLPGRAELCLVEAGAASKPVITGLGKMASW